MFNSQFDSSLLAGSPQEDFCFCFANNSAEDEVVVRSSRRMLSCPQWGSALLQLGERGKGDKDRENGRDQLVNTACQATQRWEPGSCLIAHPATETAGGKKCIIGQSKVKPKWHFSHKENEVRKLSFLCCWEKNPDIKRVAITAKSGSD